MCHLQNAKILLTVNISVMGFGALGCALLSFGLSPDYLFGDEVKEGNRKL